MAAEYAEAAGERCVEQATEWPLWGGAARLVVRATGRAELKAARVAVDSWVMAVDRACSRFRPDSEVSILAATDGGPRPVSPLLAHAIAAALRAAELTDGAVDPTLGTALVAAGYDRDLADLAESDDSHAEPSPTAGIPLRRNASWRDIDLDGTAGTVRTPPGVLLDLGATAKALAADLAAQAAYAATGVPVLVCLCGDISVAGTQVGEPWLVRVVERPDDVDGPLVRIHDGGLATSTTRARRWVQAGRPMHHLLDPATGLPVREVWRTVTVAAGSCLDANIASTATVVKGADGAAWLGATGLPARLVSAEGDVRGLNDWPVEALEALRLEAEEVAS